MNPIKWKQSLNLDIYSEIIFPKPAKYFNAARLILNNCATGTHGLYNITI